MGCTTHFLGFRWEHHSWRPQVTFSETMTGRATDMWAREVYRDYVRCDKQYVCDACGVVGRKVSCQCDVARADRCPPLLQWLAESRAAASAAEADIAPPA